MPNNHSARFSSWSTPMVYGWSPPVLSWWNSRVVELVKNWGLNRWIKLVQHWWIQRFSWWISWFWIDRSGSWVPWVLNGGTTRQAWVFNWFMNGVTTSFTVPFKLYHGYPFELLRQALWMQFRAWSSANASPCAMRWRGCVRWMTRCRAQLSPVPSISTRSCCLKELFDNFLHFSHGQQAWQFCTLGVSIWNPSSHARVSYVQWVICFMMLLSLLIRK